MVSASWFNSRNSRLLCIQFPLSMASILWWNSRYSRLFSSQYPLSMVSISWWNSRYSVLCRDRNYEFEFIFGSAWVGPQNKKPKKADRNKKSNITPKRRIALFRILFLRTYLEVVFSFFCRPSRSTTLFDLKRSAIMGPTQGFAKVYSIA